MTREMRPRRTTSAGYRLPLPDSTIEIKQSFVRPRSAYHESCVPKRKQQQHAVSQEPKNFREGDYNQCDAVTTDKIWKQNVESERRCIKNWGDNWGFLAEYDEKGRPKTPKELPESVSLFSESSVPNTNSGNYGGRLNTDVAQKMQSLEFRFYSEQRRKKLGGDLICY